MKVRIKDWKARQIEKEIRFKFHDAAVVITEPGKDVSAINFSGILCETEKAYLFSYDDPDLGISVWCPKSLVDDIEEDESNMDCKEQETSDIFKDAEMIIAEYENDQIEENGVWAFTTKSWHWDNYRIYIDTAIVKNAFHEIESAEKIEVRTTGDGWKGEPMTFLKKRGSKWIDDFSSLKNVCMADEYEEDEDEVQEYNFIQMCEEMLWKIKNSVELVENRKADDVQIIIDGDCVWNASGNEIEFMAEEAISSWCKKMYDSHYHLNLY